MKTTLHPKVGHAVLILGVIKYIMIICFFALPNIQICYAQKNNSEEEKKILFLSCLLDETSLNGYYLDGKFDLLVNDTKSNYKSFKYKASKCLNLHYWGNEEYGKDIYSVQLFKINQEYASYYVLKFESTKNTVVHFWDTVWIRIAGYTECDLKIFFDRLLQKGMSMNRICSMIDIWRKSDPLFDELDWGCLINGYLNDKTEGECYKSNKYASLNAQCINCQIVMSGDNCSFSRTILYGDILGPDI